MRFTERNNIVWKLLLLFIAFAACQSFVACQMEEQTGAEKVTAALEQCRELLDKDDFIRATDCYDAAMTANPAKATKITRIGNDAVLDKCVELFDKGNYEQSLVCVNPAAVLKDEKVNIYFLLADSFYRQSFVPSPARSRELLNRAEISVKQSLKISPDNAAAHGLYGEISSEKFEYGKAMDEFRQAIRLAPETPVYWMRVADIQERDNDYWGAITSYHQVLLIDSDNAAALYSLGFLYEKIDRIDDAISSYEKLLQVKADYNNAREKLEELKKRREDEKQYKSPKSSPSSGGQGRGGTTNPRGKR